jgi:hypothetical protein
MTGCCKILKNITSVTCIMLIRQVYFLVYKLEKFLHFVDTPPTMEGNKNSGLHCYLYVMLMVVINYHHL